MSFSFVTSEDGALTKRFGNQMGSRTLLDDGLIKAIHIGKLDKVAAIFLESGESISNTILGIGKKAGESGGEGAYPMTASRMGSSGMT
jgi:hypothetical protein